MFYASVFLGMQARSIYCVPSAMGPEAVLVLHWLISSLRWAQNLQPHSYFNMTAFIKGVTKEVLVVSNEWYTYFFDKYVKKQE